MKSTFFHCARLTRRPGFVLSLPVVIGLLFPASSSAQVIAWGSGSSGQTNIPPSATNVVAVAAGAAHSAALRNDGTVVCWGSGAATNVPATLTNAIAITSGMYHGLALLADNTVAAWGTNNYGQTTVPPQATNVVVVAAGYYHNLALRADGTVVAWGKNTYGQCNVPASATNVVAISAGAEHSMALGRDGSLAVWGGSTAYPLANARILPPGSVTDVAAVSAGAVHNLGIEPGGTVFAWGYTFDQPHVPSAATNIVAVAAGTNYNLALSAGGAVVAWGNGAVTNVPLSATNIVAIAAGLSHGLALKGDGSPRILGPVAYRDKVSVGNDLPFYARAVGQGTLTCQWTSNGIPLTAADAALPRIPSSLGSDGAAYQVIVTNSLGQVSSTIARVTVSVVHAWGRNTVGQCNLPNSVTNPVSTSAGGFHALALNANGAVTGWGRNRDGQTQVPSNATNVVAIAAGGNHSLALGRDGTVIAWGRNWDGQANVPAAATNVVAIAAGLAHSLALRGDGTVVAWGSNETGQSEPSFLGMNVMAIAAGYYHNLVLRPDGTVSTWGWDVPVPPDATNVVTIAAGWEHCLALRGDGTVVAWGDNTYGQSSVPASATNVVKLAAGWYHNMALRADGTVIAWGRGVNGVTNVPPALRDVADIAVGEDYNLALVNDGPPRFSSLSASVVASAGGAAVVAASLSGAGNLSLQWFHDGAAVEGGTNATLFLAHCQMADQGDYVLVATNAAGQASSQVLHLVVQADPATISAVGAWGDSRSGQCMIPPSVQNPRAIAAGSFHALALNADGTVVAWGGGRNRDGQTNVPPWASDVISIAAGGYHSMALRRDGYIVAWGRNWDGQLNVPPGLSNVAGIAAGTAHSVALGRDGTVTAWGSSEFGQTNVSPLARGVMAVAAGYYHTLALLSNRTVVAWGLENTVPASATNVVAISGGWWHSLALRGDGTVVAWGDNSHGQCSVPASVTNAVGVSAGWYHSMALRSDGTVVAWGAGYCGVLNVPGDLRNVASIAAGQDYCLALVELGPPRLEGIPNSVVSHVGGTLTLGAQVTGTHPLDLQWLHNGAVIDGATQPYLLLTNLALSDSGTYTLTATNDTRQSRTQGTYLAIEPGPAVEEVFALQNVLVGGSVCLFARVTGNEPATYRWSLNGVELTDNSRITGTSSRVLCIQDARNEDSGTYTLAANNAYGSATGVVGQVSVSAVVAWGDNSVGQFAVPPRISEVVAIASGGDNNAAFTANNAVVAWGDNSLGKDSLPEPTTDIVTVAFGDSHGLALRGDGSIAAWGDSHSWQALPGDTLLVSLTNVVAIAAGRCDSLALRMDGSVFSWSPDLAHPVPAAATNVAAIVAGDGYRLALRADGTLITWGDLVAAPARATNVVAIAGGAKHALALRADGELVAWGSNSYGQTNVPVFVTNILAIAAGGDHSMVLLASRTVVCWGANDSGQTSVPSWATNVSAISAGSDHSLALIGGASPTRLPPLGGGTVVSGHPRILYARTQTGQKVSYEWLWNGRPIPGATNRFLYLLPSAGDAGIYSVRVTDYFGTVESAGAALQVQELPPKITIQPTDTSFSISAPLVVAASVEGSWPITYQWWRDGEPVPGTKSVSLKRSPSMLSMAGDYWLLVSNAFGVATSAVVRVTALPVAVWGRNSYYGEATAPAGLTNVTAIAGGSYHSLALRSDGTVVAWGDNFYGQTNVPVGLTNVTAIAAGYSHSLALRSNGTVVAWGYNSSGQTNVPAGLTNVTAIAGGSYHSLALRSDGTVVAWGENSYGQANVPVGLTNVTAIAGGCYHCLALRSNGTVVAWGYNSSGQVKGLTNVTAIAGGYQHSLALRSNGTVVAWGHNSYGQTNVPAGLTNVMAIAAGNYHSLALRSDGTVVAWGDNSYGQADVPADLTNVMAIAAGYYHSLALMAAPVLGGGPQSQTNVVGAMATFKVIAAGNAPLAYQWQKDGTNLADGNTISGTHTSNLTLSATTMRDAGGYRVVITNAYGSVTSSIATLVFSPGIVTQPQSLTIASGSPAILSVVAAGTDPLAYQWFVAGSRQSNATAEPFVINGFVLAVEMTSSGAGYLTVPQVQFIGGSGSGAGGYATVSNRMVTGITVTNAGYGYTTPPTVQIDPPAIISLPGQTNAALVLPAVTSDQAANYFVTVINPFGMVTSSAAALTVFLPPQAFTADIGTNGQLHFQFGGTPGWPYSLQSTTNLAPPVAWEPLVTQPADAGGAWHCVETNLLAPQRFYRVVTP